MIVEFLNHCNINHGILSFIVCSFLTFHRLPHCKRWKLFVLDYSCFNSYYIITLHTPKSLHWSLLLTRLHPHSSHKNRPVPSSISFNLDSFLIRHPPSPFFFLYLQPLLILRPFFHVLKLCQSLDKSPALSRAPSLLPSITMMILEAAFLSRLPSTTTTILHAVLYSHDHGRQSLQR